MLLSWLSSTKMTKSRGCRRVSIKFEDWLAVTRETMMTSSIFDLILLAFILFLLVSLWSLNREHEKLKSQVKDLAKLTTKGLEALQKQNDLTRSIVNDTFDHVREMATKVDTALDRLP